MGAVMTTRVGARARVEIARDAIEAERIAQLWHDRGVCTPALKALRAEIESLRAERDALREGAKRVADLLEENGCNCDCECDSDGHDDDCDPCLACRVDAAIRRAHMWTHVDDLRRIRRGTR